jgi:hypothetical protein
VLLLAAGVHATGAASPEPPSGQVAQSQTQDGDADLTLPEIHYDDAILPDAVVQTRNALLRTARTGDLERVRGVLDAVAPNLIYSFGADDDAIAYWRQVSMDGTGRDILADMIKVFSSGYVVVNQGTADELFVWPYHFIYEIDDLTPEQEVELYLLVPAQYRQDMEDAGGYIGFRAAINPAGELIFFVAGD